MIIFAQFIGIFATMIIIFYSNMIPSDSEFITFCHFYVIVGLDFILFCSISVIFPPTIVIDVILIVIDF